MTRPRLFMAALLLIIVAGAAALPMLALSRGFLHLGSFHSESSLPQGTPLLVIGGTVSLPHGARAPVMVVGGRMRLDGKATDVVIGLDSDVLLAAHVSVSSDLVDLGGRIYRAPGAALYGNVVGIAGAWDRRTIPGHLGLLHNAQLAALASLSIFVLALLVSAAFPWRVLIVAATVRRYSWQSLAVATGGLACLPLVCVPLLLSVVGLPLALLLALAALSLWLTGVSGAGLLIGQRLLVACGRVDSLLRSTFVGLIVLALLGIIPGFGPLVLLCLGCLGAGATVLSLIDRSRAVTMIVSRQS